MKKTLIILLFLLIVPIIPSLQTVPTAQASSLWDMQVDSGIEKIGSDAYGVNDASADNYRIQVIIARIIKVFLGLLGIIFVIMLVWAGYKYMISQGNEEKISESIGQIRTAIIGLIIILISWSITSYIMDCVLDITQGGMLWMCQ